MSIGSILRSKPRRILSVLPSTSVAEVAAQLAEHRVGTMLVCDEGGRLVGILSERDVVRSLPRNGAATLEMTADTLMTSAIHTVTPETTVRTAMEMMTNGRVRHLPVLDAGALVGLVSIGDVVKEMLDQQAQEVDSLRQYVTGAG